MEHITQATGANTTRSEHTQGTGRKHLCGVCDAVSHAAQLMQDCRQHQPHQQQQAWLRLLSILSCITERGPRNTCVRECHGKLRLTRMCFYWIQVDELMPIHNIQGVIHAGTCVGSHDDDVTRASL
eukprot:TRINITY_DN39797_c0_g1_i1.p1 TRINITY_DN39797_c0_g1~~TRINITY_DN39797_c0_g1_i1.p1  ORF type:complete len:126 (+),score=5.72 TRINITY_DN39797_c0_g1_i1:219-596(+)